MRRDLIEAPRATRHAEVARSRLLFGPLVACAQEVVLAGGGARQLTLSDQDVETEQAAVLIQRVTKHLRGMPQVRMPIAR